MNIKYNDIDVNENKEYNRMNENIRNDNDNKHVPDCTVGGQ